MEWQPIESCPKLLDEWFIVYYPSFGWFKDEYVNPAYVGDNEYWEKAQDLGEEPTHWMYGPKPPEATA